MSMLNEATRGSLTDTRDRSLIGRIKDIIPWKGDDIKEIVRKLVFITAMCVLCYSVYDAYVYKFGSSSMINDQRELASHFNLDDVTEPKNPDNSSGNNQNTVPAVVPDNTNGEQNNDDITEPVNSKYPAGMLSTFEYYYDINPDIVGWLSIDGIYLDDKKPENERELAINYPVVQSDDNDYYLAHDFYGQEKDYGALYADFRATAGGDGRSDNVTIYGHNMGSGNYFHHIAHDYNNKSSAKFVSEHRIIDFTSLYKHDQYIIVGCFLVGIYESDDNQPIFRYHNVVDFNDDPAQFDYWYKNVMYRNYYTTDIDCDINDVYLTLSTCSYEISDSRFVVVARRLREGEDPSVYTYRSNPNKHMPKRYLKAFDLNIREDDGPDYEYYTP